MLYELRQEPGFLFRGFHQMSRAEVAELTGLSLQAASLARRRLASEPLIWGGTPEALALFSDALGEHDLRLQKGGRFHHVTSHVSKADALFRLLVRAGQTGQRAPSILACGDSPNDLELIDAADQALLFPQRDGRFLREASPTLHHAPVAGPSCWLSSVRKILDRGTA